MRHDELVALVEAAHGCEETVAAEDAAMYTFNPWADAILLAEFRRQELVASYGPVAVKEAENIHSVSEYPMP